MSNEWFRLEEIQLMHTNNVLRGQRGTRLLAYVAGWILLLTGTDTGHPVPHRFRLHITGSVQQPLPR